MPEEGFDVEPKAHELSVERIAIVDLKPEVPESGGSVFVLQRNAKDRDNRSLPVDSPDFGALDAGEAEATQTQSKEFFDAVFKDLAPEERQKIDILVVAGNAFLQMPDGKKSPKKRAVDTAKHVLAGIQASMAEYDIAKSQLLNKPSGPELNVNPIELTSGRLIDLKMFDESPEFVQFLLNKYGNTKDFWVAYEIDRHKEEREHLGAEGPDDIAERVGNYMATLDNAMKLYHLHHPDRRVIVWAISQYDSISPFLKKHVTGQPMDDYLQVDYRAGVVFKVKNDGQTSAKVQGQEYEVSLSQSS